MLITAAVLSAAEHGAEIEGHGVEMTMVMIFWIFPIFA